MSTRSLVYTLPAPSHADSRPADVTVGDLRRLRAAVAYLAALAQANSTWDPDTDAPEDEPDDLRAASDAASLLASLLGS